MHLVAISYYICFKGSSHGSHQLIHIVIVIVAIVIIVVIVIIVAIVIIVSMVTMCILSSMQAVTRMRVMVGLKSTRRPQSEYHRSAADSSNGCNDDDDCERDCEAHDYVKARKLTPQNF